MKLLSLIIIFKYLSVYVLALLVNPLAPANDTFYRSPANLSSYEEGDIMKWRSTPQMIQSVLYSINIEHAWQFMVRSTDNKGNPIAIVGTIIKPYGADPDKVLAYNYAEDSASKNCAPSYAILFGANPNTITTQLESAIMNVGLAKGWYVLVTDHEGPNAAFTAGTLAGMAVLNAIRATLKSGNDTGISPDAKVAIWGFSGGTVPSGWAAALQPSRAPELSDNLVGVAVGGWVTNITQVVQYLDGTFFAGFVGAGIMGLITEAPEHKDLLYSLVRPLKLSLMMALTNQCEISTLLRFTNASFFKGPLPIFSNGTSVLYLPEVQDLMLNNILSVNRSGPVPDVPMFVYHGIPDEIIPVSGSQRVYDNWCAQGIASMEFTVSKSSGHIVEFAEGAAAALSWITNRFNGDDPVQGCNRTERNSNLEYPGADVSFFQTLRTTYGAFTKLEVGPDLLADSTPSKLKSSLYKLIAGLVGMLGPLPI